MSEAQPNRIPKLRRLAGRNKVQGRGHFLIEKQSCGVVPEVRGGCRHPGSVFSSDVRYQLQYCDGD
jgi:hypothetical protein